MAIRLAYRKYSFAALAAGVLALLVFELLVRFGHVRWWPFVGSTAPAISMLGPSYQADGETAMALMALHFIVGIVLIWGLSLTRVQFVPRTDLTAR